MDYGLFWNRNTMFFSIAYILLKGLVTNPKVVGNNQHVLTCFDHGTHHVCHVDLLQARSSMWKTYYLYHNFHREAMAFAHLGYHEK